MPKVTDDGNTLDSQLIKVLSDMDRPTPSPEPTGTVEGDGEVESERPDTTVVGTTDSGTDTGTESEDGTEDSLRKLYAQSLHELAQLKTELAQLKDKPTEEPFELSDEAYEGVFRDKNQFLEVVKNASAKNQQKLLLEIPKVVNTMIQQAMYQWTVRNDFYTRNADLQPHAAVVHHVAEQLQAEHPDWSQAQVLMETEKQARRQLRLGRTEPPPVQPKTTSVRQPTAPNTRKAEDTLEAYLKRDLAKLAV